MKMCHAVFYYNVIHIIFPVVATTIGARMGLILLRVSCFAVENIAIKLLHPFKKMHPLHKIDLSAGMFASLCIIIIPLKSDTTVLVTKRTVFSVKISLLHAIIEGICAARIVLKS